MPVGDSAPNAEGVRSILYAPMRRRLIQLSLFLLLGAIINVAVAWTAAILESSDGSLDCMIEGGLFHPEERSRYADAGICVQRTAWRSRLSIIFADYEGGWRDVPSLDAEVPTWADALLTERAIAQLRERHVGRERFVEAAGWPCLGMSGSFAVEWTGSIASCTVIEHDCAVVLPPRLKRWATYAGMSRLLPLRPIWPGFAINTRCSMRGFCGCCSPRHSRCGDAGASSAACARRVGIRLATALSAPSAGGHSPRP
jgi:hypothetical protein